MLIKAINLSARSALRIGMMNTIATIKGLSSRDDLTWEQSFEAPLEARAYLYRRMGCRSQNEYIDSEDFKQDYPKVKPITDLDKDYTLPKPLFGTVLRHEIKQKLNPGSEFSYTADALAVGSGRLNTRLYFAKCAKVARVNVFTPSGYKIRINALYHIWIDEERFKVVD